MRIWDIPPEKLCRNHLLGEHRELHAVWAVITDRRGGTPHTRRLPGEGWMRAQYLRHEALVDEMCRRGYAHKSQPGKRMATGGSRQDTFVDSPARRIQILRQEGCGCAA